MSNVIRKLVDAVSGESSTRAHADSDMQEVLDQLASMNGRPIENLDGRIREGATHARGRSHRAPAQTG